MNTHASHVHALNHEINNECQPFYCFLKKNAWNIMHWTQHIDIFKQKTTVMRLASQKKICFENNHEKSIFISIGTTLNLEPDP